MRSSCFGATEAQPPAMEIEFVEPRAELRPYIESFWIFDGRDGLPLADASIVAETPPKKLFVLSFQ